MAPQFRKGALALFFGPCPVPSWWKLPRGGQHVGAPMPVVMFFISFVAGVPHVHLESPTLASPVCIFSWSDPGSASRAQTFGSISSIYLLALLLGADFLPHSSPEQATVLFVILLPLLFGGSVCVEGAGHVSQQRAAFLTPRKN